MKSGIGDKYLREELFITGDSCFISNGSGEGKSSGQSQSQYFLRLGRSRQRDERKCYFRLRFPDLRNSQITEVKLCLHQYFADVRASSVDTFSLTFSNGSASSSPYGAATPSQTFKFFNNDNGKKCIPIEKRLIPNLQKSDGVTMKAKVSGNKKERYFISSQWTSSSKGVNKAASDLTYHPHWVIKTVNSDRKPPTNSPVSSPVSPPISSPVSPPISPPVSPPISPPTISPPIPSAISLPIPTPTPAPIPSMSDLKPNKSNNSGMYALMWVGFSVLIFAILFSIIYCSILIVRRRKAETEREKILRTFVNEDEICHTGKYSFNSMNNSSNKADSGNSGRSLKWIENVKLDGGGGDGTICDKIDEKIDSAAFPDIEKPYFSSSLNAVTPRQRNPGELHNFFKNSPSINNSSKSNSLSYEQEQDTGKKLQNQRRHQESMRRVRDRITKNKLFLKSRMHAPESNSIIDSNDESYPSLLTSYSSSGEEDSITRKKRSKEKGCLEDAKKECHATEKDGKKCCFGEACGSTASYHTNQSSTAASTAQSSSAGSTLIYSSDESSCTYSGR